MTMSHPQTKTWWAEMSADDKVYIGGSFIAVFLFNMLSGLHWAPNGLYLVSSLAVFTVAAFVAAGQEKYPVSDAGWFAVVMYYFAHPNGAELGFLANYVVVYVLIRHVIHYPSSARWPVREATLCAALLTWFGFDQWVYDSTGYRLIAIVAVTLTVYSIIKLIVWLQRDEVYAREKYPLRRREPKTNVISEIISLFSPSKKM